MQCNVREPQGGFIRRKNFCTEGVYTGNGTRTDYTINAAGLATNVTNMRGNTILSRFDYAYYLDGNVSRVTEGMGSETRTTIYTYDLARRLTGENETSNVPVFAPTVTVASWTQLRNAIDSAPADRPITIHVSRNFDSSNDGAITIPANRNITLVGQGSKQLDTTK